MEPPSSNGAMKIRRAHKKSRFGCRHCKKRKVKCDEVRPVCRNCVRSDTTCVYDCQPRQDAAGISSTTPSAHDSPPCIAHQSRDLELMLLDRDKQLDEMSQRLSDLETEIHRLRCQQVLQPPNCEANCLFQCYRTMIEGSGPFPGSFWNEDLPRLSMKYRYVLHLMLGLAALYQAQSSPHQHNYLISTANHYYGLGLSSVIALMNDAENQVCDTAVSTATCILISLYTLALGPQPGDYMGFSTNGRPNLLILLRGFKALKSGKPRDNISLPVVIAYQPEPLAMLDASAEYELKFLQLRTLIYDMPSLVQTTYRNVYLLAIDQLIPFYKTIYKSKKYTMEPTSNAQQQPLAWLYCVPETYVNLLEAKDPVALVIFAYFSVVLEHINTPWPIRGWPQHIIVGVEGLVPDILQSYLKWPLEQVGRKIN